MKSIRNNIPDRSLKEVSIQNQLFDFINIHNVKKIGIYISFDSEFDTKNIISYCIAHNIDVYIPKINQNNMLDFYKFDGNYLKLIKGKFNILEPKEDMNNINNNLEHMIIPGLATDKNNYRIGYGKGYYDRYIKSYNIPYKIGLFFKEQILEFIPHDDNDLKYDIIFSDLKIN